MPPALVKQPLSINLNAKNKKIVFDDDEAAEATAGKKSASGGAAKQRQGGANTGDTKKNKHIKFGGDDESAGGAKHHKDKKAHNNNNKHIKFDEAPASAKANKSKHIVFDVDEEEDVETTKVKPMNGAISKANKNNKHIKFDADGEEDEAVEAAAGEEEEEEDEDDYFAKREKMRQAQTATDDGADDEAEAQKKWYQVFPSNTSMEDCEDMKDAEHMELYKVCKGAFEAETPAFNRRNPSDGRWLQTALHKGTAKDRANAGALLVTSNPLGNLEALGTLIGFTKVSNKSSTDVIAILTDLWKEVLLPPYRKLMSLQMRSKDWKELRKEQPNAAKQRRIYAYWYFESELKDQYFEFLKNLQQNIQTGQENSKSTSIVAASKLLAYAPEKEQMLLTMLINKLGDPVPKVASKALHHLTEVGHKHPNMCGVIVAEAEKLLFRNNISERAQHFALCFLASIAPAGRPEVCTKLVHICFALFKVLVQKGAVNNRTMQAILRCLQKAILEAKPAEGSTELLTKEMQDTVYRLVHLADIRVSVQTLGLLLQLVSVKTEKSDRFYNALYKKLLDLELVQVGTKTSAQLLHIVHRAVHIDANVPRAKAFIKRLLQLSLYMPPQMAAGSLIVLHKLLKMRKELLCDVGGGDGGDGGVMEEPLPVVQAGDEELQKFDSDGEEKYEDIKDDEEEEKAKDKKQEAVGDGEEDGEEKDDEEKDGEKAEKKPPAKTSSWHHAKVETAADAMKVREISASKYDPTHRVPSFAGAEYALPNELLLLREHYHPTVQVFADNILNNKRIDYYGDPLRDFGLAHFLERFAFKNPKKSATDKADPSASLSHKRYVAFGTRGKSVKSLTKTNCTEDEMYIFNFLEQKRKQSVNAKVKKSARKDDDDDEDEDEAPLKAGEVDDDEFDEYLDGYFGKKAKAAALAEDEAGDDDDEDEIDFLKELGGELKGDEEGKKRKKKGKASVEDDEDEVDDIDADWGDDDEGPEFDEDDEDEPGGEISDDEDESIDLNEEEDDDDDDEDGPNFSDDDDEDDDDDDDDEEGDALGEDSDDSSPPLRKAKKKKASTEMNERSFAKKLKHSDDMSSLFAAADDFAELLEETGKTKGQGTANAVFNKDKSSDKQLKWEEKRRSNSKTYGGAAKRKAGGGGGGNKKHGGGAKKRKH